MKLLYGLSERQMQDVYGEVLYNECLDEIYTRLSDGNYGKEMKAKGFEMLSRAEIHEAAEWLQDNFLSYVYWADGGEHAIDYVLSKRPTPKPSVPDLLNETLKKIGLKTMQRFKINDAEFRDQTLCIDSFGDVYVVVTEATDDYYDEGDEVEHDYLTLGRILTQYYDKIVPWDIDEVGYA